MLPQVSVKLISSLESCFLDETIESKPEKTHFLMYRNEKLSFQLACIINSHRLERNCNINYPAFFFNSAFDNCIGFV